MSAAAVAGEERETLVVRQHVRCGQRIRARGHVVVMGDVNPGAYVEAAGDILVLGRLAGVAHAGAEGDEGAVVAAFRLRPIQLRIASVYARAPDGGPRGGVAVVAGGDFSGRAASPAGLRPELARLRGGAVVIEPMM